MRPRWILKGIGMLILGALFVAAFGWVTMHLWNWLVPALFKGPTIDIAQAFGLLLLTRLLFGFGFRGRGGGWHGGGPRGYIHGRMRERWRAKMEAKWATLTPEERDKKREAFRRHCGNWRWEEPDCAEPGATTGSDGPKS